MLHNVLCHCSLSKCLEKFAERTLKRSRECQENPSRQTSTRNATTKLDLPRSYKNDRQEELPTIKFSNVGTSIIGIGLWGILYYVHVNGESPKEYWYLGLFAVHSTPGCLAGSQGRGHEGECPGQTPHVTSAREREWGPEGYYKGSFDAEKLFRKRRRLCVSFTTGFKS